METQERAGGYMCQKVVRNPHASAPLVIPIAVMRNTTRERIDANVTTNAAKPLAWVDVDNPRRSAAVIVGGGPSAEDHIDEILEHARAGAAVFALNAASAWLGDRVPGRMQVMVDAKPDSLELLDHGAALHLIASQVDPATVDAAPHPVLWHVAMEGLQALLPPERQTTPAVGGGASVGMAACCLAYVMGYRRLHLYGYDSSHRDGCSHAYRQPMNDKIPTLETTWAGRTFTSSVAMKAQAEWFPILARQLRDGGCEVSVHGDGLLPTIVNTPPECQSERDKYRLLWGTEIYRKESPGEACVPAFLDMAKPNGLVVDFGCGTGRAGLALAAAGLPVFLVDFAGNCRDHEAHALPFLEHDLSEPIQIGVRAPYGFCVDMMEHIPPHQTRAVLENITQAADRVFFRIDTQPDAMGAVIGQTLHMNVRPHWWWRDVLADFGAILNEIEGPSGSIFYIQARR